MYQVLTSSIRYLPYLMVLGPHLTYQVLTLPHVSGTYLTSRLGVLTSCIRCLPGTLGAYLMYQVLASCISYLPQGMTCFLDRRPVKKKSDGFPYCGFTHHNSSLLFRFSVLSSLLLRVQEWFV